MDRWDCAAALFHCNLGFCLGLFLEIDGCFLDFLLLCVCVLSLEALLLRVLAGGARSQNV